MQVFFAVYKNNLTLFMYILNFLNYESSFFAYKFRTQSNLVVTK